jgi:phosphatidate cytidylyltransferase
MKRLLTAVALAPLIVWVVLAAPVPLFLAVLATVGLLCFHEYTGIAKGFGILPPGPVGYVAGLLFLLAPQDPVLVLTLLTLVAITLNLGLDDLRASLPRAASLLLGLVYIFGSWRAAITLRGRSPHWLLFALVLNWVGDAAAYYVGRSIGKHKLAPRVSPNKSWEGSIASAAASVVFGVLYLPRFVPGVDMGTAAALALAANAAGQLGDLAESALKRGAGVKDSGHMLPGHGGWLDRVDSSLFSVPVVCWLVLALGL